MEHPFLTGMVALTLLLGLTLATQFSPDAFARLGHSALWLTVATAVLPPLIAALTGWHHSEDSTLWIFLCGSVALGAAIVAYLVGLFLPAGWSWWSGIAVSAGAWAVIGVGGWLLSWYGHRH